MDEMACFQDCKTGLDDDDFIDLEDGPQVAQHWFENCSMIDKEKDVSKDWSDDLSFFTCDSSDEDFDHEEPELIPLPFVNPLHHLKSSLACWIMTILCFILMCFDFNRLTLCMSLLQTVFISMQKLHFLINLMAEHLRQDGCVNGGFECYPVCLMVLSCVMMVVWFVGVSSDASKWKFTIKSILTTSGI